ncbi:hypothetical protein [Streptomyces filamentosus]|uniref:hypothetical protein n=1 Tax=Streptomyces filamentosus TaxID=67294 RepID=UPI0033FC6215
MTDKLEERRRTPRGRPSRRPTVAPRPAEPPRWVRTFVIPRNACDPCARHHHHRCHGADVLRDPVPNCPCDCGDPRDPSFLNPRAWADLAVHAPEEVWVAALLERQRAAGIHTCTWRADGSGLHTA